MKSKSIAGIFITDTHLDELNSENVYNIFKQTVDLCKEKGVEEFFHLGDIFNSRISQKLSTLLSFQRIITLLEDNGITMHVIPGNHDKTDQSSTNSYLDIYRSENLIVTNSYSFVDLNGVRLISIPFFTEDIYKDYLLKASKILSPKLHNVLGTHIGIHGVLNNNNSEVENKITQSDFKQFDKVLIGHYHNATQVSKKISYIGSTDPRNFGEDDKKGALILYSDLSVENYKFKFKTYKKVRLDIFEGYEVEKISNELALQLEDSNIQIEFVGSDEDLIKIDSKVLESKGFKVSKKTVSSLKMFEEIEEGVKHSLNLSNESLMSELKLYCKENKIKETKLNKIIKYL
jgi:DNA repair exonuclease SbcCD nuclease subunit